MMDPVVIEIHDHQRYAEAMIVRSYSAGTQTTYRCRYVNLDGDRCTQVWTSDVARLSPGTHTMTVNQVRRAQQPAETTPE